MGKPHPVELRERAVALVVQGNTHTETARRLCVSIKFVNDMVRLKRETGALDPKPQGNPGRGKLTCVRDWVQARIAAVPEMRGEGPARVLSPAPAPIRQSSSRAGRRPGPVLSHKKRP